MDHFDVAGVNFGFRERISHHFGGQIGEVMAFAGEVAREIALIAAEDPDVGSAHERTSTTIKRVTRAHSAAVRRPRRLYV